MNTNKQKFLKVWGSLSGISIILLALVFLAFGVNLLHPGYALGMFAICCVSLIIFNAVITIEALKKSK